MQNSCIKIPETVKAYRSFLKTVSNTPMLHTAHVLKYALWRYETKWLPLVKNYQENDLEPPLDIHWIWNAHLLNPKNYNKDCAAYLGCVPDHKIHLTHRKEIQERTMKIWREVYPEEPFHLDFDNITETDQNFMSSLSYDVIAAARHQAAFFYNIALPHYNDDKFLRSANERYLRFVALKKKDLRVFIVPTYDVDLVWHTHIVHHHAYIQDTTRYLTFVLNHDDSTTDRTPGSFLCISQKQTNQLWLQSYCEPFYQPGAMYRGADPKGVLFENPEEQILAMSPNKLFSLTVCDLEIQLDHPTYNVSTKIKIHQKDTLGSDQKERLPRIKKPPFKWTSNRSSFTVDSGRKISMNISVDQTQLGLKGFFGGKTCIGTATFDLTMHLDQRANAKQIHLSSTFAPQGPHDTSKIFADILAKPISLADFTLNMVGGNFQKAVLQEDAEQIWGPVKLPHPPHGGGKEYTLASHRLTDQLGNTAFMVRVVHSLQLVMSAVQVFYKDKMVAVSHLVGSNQLPMKKQVKHPGQCVTLDQTRGERAMLIKNIHGDWGIVKAKWTGMECGYDGMSGSPGFLEVEFNRVVSGCKSSCHILHEYSPHFFRLNNTTVNVRDNIITLHGQQQDLAENAALAFSAMMLVILCQPRPEVGATGEVPKHPPMPVIRGGQEVKTVKTHQYDPFLFVGWNVDVPSNSWLYWHSHNCCRNASADSTLSIAECDIGDSSFCPWKPSGTQGGEDISSGCGACGSEFNMWMM